MDHVIYINIDGLAKYYYDEFIKREKNSFLETLKEEGVFFENLKNVLPSITNPCQNMILSGSTSLITKNIYRYYDNNKNIVVQQRRENETKLFTDVAVSENKKVVSVAHFLTENHLTKDNYKKLYIKNNNYDNYNYEKRFNQLIKVINKEPVMVDGKEIVVKEFPNLLVLYVDDLDGLGHNFQSTYNSVVAKSEEERINNVVNTLSKIDKKIEEMTQALKKNNLYDKTNIFITTDHGMTPYGSYVEGVKDKYTYSKINELIKKIKHFDNKLKIEFLSPNEKAKEDTNLVLVGANLNLFLKFRNNITSNQLNDLKNHLIKEEYVYNIKTKEELEKEELFWTKHVDMVISPSERYHFSKDVNKEVYVKGQHDSMQPSSNQIVGWIYGGNTKKLGSIKETYYNYDFGVTIANKLKIELPKYNGKNIKVFD